MYLSDVLPTAWQAVEYAVCPRAARSRSSVWARSERWRAGSPHRGDCRVLGVDLVAGATESCAGEHCDDLIDLRSGRRSTTSSATLTDGRGADAVIDAVGMEAHGAPIAEVAQTARVCCRRLGRAVMETRGN